MTKHQIFNSANSTGRLAGFRGAPTTEADLIAACRLLYPHGCPEGFVQDLFAAIHEPDAVCPEEILIAVSMVSPQHRTRMQAYMKWTDAEMNAASERIAAQMRRGDTESEEA